MAQLDPMTAEEAREYGPQWGSYMNGGDPGYIMYTAVSLGKPNLSVKRQMRGMRWLQRFAMAQRTAHSVRRLSAVMRPHNDTGV